jgi:hypothetical protein
MTEVLKTITHKDKTIEVQWTYGKVLFVLTNVDVARTSFDTLEKAKEAIDQFFSTQARVITNAVAISRNLLDGKGQPLTVVGINRNDGTLKVKNYTPVGHYGRVAKETSYSGDLYPDRPWIKEVLVELHELAKREAELNSKISKAKLRHYRSSYHKIAIDEYEPRIHRLTKEIDDAEQQANYLEAANAKKSA